MANIVSGKNTRGRAMLQTMMFNPTFAAATVTQFYRGGAVALFKRTAAKGGADVTEDGTVHRTLDGTVDSVFAGICMRDVAVPATAVAAEPLWPKYGIPVSRMGSARFVTASAADWWKGRKVFFTDDQTVALNPPAQEFPLLAGTVIEVHSATEIEVEFTEAVNWVPKWNWINICPGTAEQATLIATINNSTVHLIKDNDAVPPGSFQTSNLTWLHQFVGQTVALSVGGDTLYQVLIGANGLGSGLTFGTAAPALVEFQSEIIAGANAMHTGASPISIHASSASDITAGNVNLWIKMLSL